MPEEGIGGRDLIISDKSDFREVKEVFEAWWNGRLDRPLIQIFSPRNAGVISTDLWWWSFLQYHPDVDKALDKIFEYFSMILFLKEAYPNVIVNLGPGILSAYLGAELKFDAKTNTAWFQGDFSLDDIENIKFIPENKWWKYTVKCTERSIKRCKDKAIVSFTDMLDPVTVTGQLRGNYPTNLLKDMFTNGHKLKKALKRIHDIWFRCYEEFCEIMNVSENGYSTWTGLWSGEKHLALQCDTIVYLSPKLFDEFAYPLIVEECDYFDRTIWHLDGPLELKHLDKLLNISELDAIQWIPGAGNPDAEDDSWLPLYKKIQDKGKMLQLYLPPEKVMHVLNKISPKGVAISTYCTKSEEARKLIHAFESKYE